MSRPAATVSVDVDPVDLHLLGYGYRGLEPDPLAYTTALPRLLDVFARTGVRATFFVVGRDADAHAPAIAALARAGHEVASHSLTHPFAFARLPDDAMRHELAESKARLERATGAPVLGYRSPNFDLDAHAAEVLLATGYRYDASAYPTPFMIPARLLLALKSRNFAEALKLKLWPFTFRRRPYAWRLAAGTLQEFPVSVTAGIRFPVYHTVRYLTGDASFEATLDDLARRGDPLSYPLHAVDVLGLAEDRVDARLARHPGMERPLADKLALLERSLTAIAKRFEPLAFRDRLAAA